MCTNDARSASPLRSPSAAAVGADGGSAPRTAARSVPAPDGARRGGAVRGAEPSAAPLRAQQRQRRQQVSPPARGPWRTRQLVPGSGTAVRHKAARGSRPTEPRRGRRSASGCGLRAPAPRPVPAGRHGPRRAAAPRQYSRTAAPGGLRGAAARPPLPPARRSLQSAFCSRRGRAAGGRARGHPPAARLTKGRTQRRLTRLTSAGAAAARARELPRRAALTVPLAELDRLQAQVLDHLLAGARGAAHGVRQARSLHRAPRRSLLWGWGWSSGGAEPRPRFPAPPGWLGSAEAGGSGFVAAAGWGGGSREARSSHPGRRV